MASLRELAIRSIVWTGSGNVVSTLLQFVFTAILANLLGPADFGAMSVILIVSGLVGLISDLGLSTAVIQDQQITAEEMSSFFYLNIFFGVVLSSTVYLCSGFLSVFFHDTSLEPILKLSSVLYILTGLSSTFRPLLQKSLRFSDMAVTDVAGVIAYGVCAIGFASQGFGAQSLVFGLLCRHGTEVLLLWRQTKFKPLPTIRFNPRKSLIRFSAFVLGERFLNYFNRNLDNILIGRFLGVEALGYYSLAYQIVMIPVSRISQIVGRIAFPIFSQVQHENDKIRSGYVHMLEYVSIVSIPLLGISVLVAPEFVRLVYGARWEPVILLIQIFSVLGMVESIGTTVGSVLYAKNRPDIAFGYNIVNLVFTAIAIIAGMQVGGTLGIASFVTILAFPLAWMWHSRTNSLIGLSWSAFLTPLRFSGFALCVVVFSGLLAKLSLNISSLSNNPVIVGGLTLATAAICFFLVLVRFRRSLVSEFMEHVSLSLKA